MVPCMYKIKASYKTLVLRKHWLLSALQNRPSLYDFSQLSSTLPCLTLFVRMFFLIKYISGVFCCNCDKAACFQTFLLTENGNTDILNGLHFILMVHFGHSTMISNFATCQLTFISVLVDC